MKRTEPGRLVTTIGVLVSASSSWFFPSTVQNELPFQNIQDHQTKNIVMRPLLFLIFVVTLFFYSCKQSSSKAIKDNEQFLGSWRFAEEQELDSTGAVINRDTNVDGLLIYSPDGKMNVQLIWKGARSKIITDTIMNNDGISSGLGLGFNKWSTEQARTIIDTYDAYFGDYSIDLKDQIVTHTMKGNLRPEKSGTIYKRRFQLRNDSLFLRDAKPNQYWQVVWVKNK